MSCKITQSDLANFYGSEHMYRHWTRKMNYTDGFHFLVQNGAGWLVDAIASYQGSRQLKTPKLQDFQLWELEVTGSSAVLTCKEDSGLHLAVITQKFGNTDFPFSIKIYVENGVCLLPSEH